MFGWLVVVGCRQRFRFFEFDHGLCPAKLVENDDMAQKCANSDGLRDKIFFPFCFQYDSDRSSSFGVVVEQCVQAHALQHRVLKAESSREKANNKTRVDKNKIKKNNNKVSGFENKE